MYNGKKIQLTVVTNDEKVESWTPSDERFPETT